MRRFSTASRRVTRSSSALRARRPAMARGKAMARRVARVAAATTPGSEGMTVTPLIELDSITKRYAQGDLSVEVLRGVSLVIQEGEFVAIMGASGSGKTTLMNIIGCMDRPSGGRYRLMGHDVAELDGDALAELRRNTFGFIFQRYNLLGNSSAQQNIQLP